MSLSLKAKQPPPWKGLLSEGVVPHVYNMDTGEILFEGGLVSGTIFEVQVFSETESDLYDGWWLIFDIDMREQFIMMKNIDTGDYEKVLFKDLKHLDPPLGIGIPNAT